MLHNLPSTISPLTCSSYSSSLPRLPPQRDLTGADDLESVQSFELRVSSEHQNLSDLGGLLPRLQVLRLDDSHVPSLRDLGLALRGLRVLSLARCQFQDLDGIAEALPAVEELYLSHNQVSDLTPLAYHPSLRTLQLQW